MGSADRTREGRSWASSPFSEAKGMVSESGDGAQNTGREAAWAHLVPGASGGGVRGRALAFGNFSDFACRAPGKNVRRRGPSRVKKPETPIRGNNLLQARPLRRSVRGSPSRQQAPRRDSRRRPLGGAAATSMAVGRRWAMDGGAEVGPAPVWRATPRARAETLRAAPETVSGTGQRGGEWGAGCGDGRQGAGAAAGGRALPPGARGGQPLTPSLRKIAPRRAAQPLRHQERGGVGAGPHEIERRRRKLAENGKNDLENFRFFGVFGRVFGRAPAPKTPSAARTAWKRLLYRRS